MPFAATWMDLEIIILSEVIQIKTNIWYHLYVESKKNYTNELTNKTETDSWLRKWTYGYQGGMVGWGDGQIESLGLTHTHCYI